MALKLLEVLEKGLTKFTEIIMTCKKELSAKLARAKTISSSDEHWLDSEENTIDKQCILECLDENERTIMMKLGEWAGDLVKVAGNKWKCTPFLMLIENKSLTTLVRVHIGSVH